MQDMPPSMLKELELGYRFGVTKQWAQAAHVTAEASKVPTASELWGFISTTTTLGVAAPDNGVEYFFSLEPTKPVDDYVFLTPVISKDSSRLAPNDDRLIFTEAESTKFAEYHHGTRAVYLSDKQFSDRGKGILLLSIMHLARDHLTNEQTESTENSQHHEAASHIFAFQLLQAFGGDAYAQLISDLEATYARTNNEVTSRLVDSSVSSPIWKQLFGEHISPAEQVLWDGAANMHAYWRFIQDQTPEPIEWLSRHLIAERSGDST